MKQNSIRFSALAAMALTVAACGTTEVIGDELTEAEAMALAEGLMSTTFSSSSEPPQGAAGLDGPAAAPFTFAGQVETDVVCPLGGMVSVAAQVEVSGDDETQELSAEYQMTQIHDGCVVQGEGENTFTLWGNPSMNAAFTVEATGTGVVEWAGSIEGMVDWESADRSGTCSVDLAFSGRLASAEESVAGELEGGICGMDLVRSFSIG